jgi:hypothetical protein
MKERNQVAGVYHHDFRQKDQAIAEALPIAKKRLETMIADGRSQMSRTIEKLQGEVNRRRDFLVPASKFELFGNAPEEGKLSEDRLGNDFGIHLQGLHRQENLRFNDYSFGQMANKLGIPVQFLKGVMEERPATVAEIMESVKYRMGDGRFMLREVDGKVRAVLSDHYKDIDQARVIQNFLKSVQETGAVPLSGELTDRRFVLRAIIGEILQPIPTEALVLGVHLSSSDYGAGALQMSVFQIRMWCTNTAIGEQLFRQIHLGGQQDGDDGLINPSARTNSLRNLTALSEMKDAMQTILSPESRDQIMEAWRIAAG